MPSIAWTERVFKPIVFILSLVPVTLLILAGFTDQLGVNPIETVTRETGSWTLRFLLMTLSVTPIRKITSWYSFIKLRRMFGLYTFFYGTLHLLTYIWFDQFFDWGAMVSDIYTRPFITAGFTAFTLMIPLAVTSNHAMIRRLGGKRWKRLHQLIYPIGIIGIVHFWWLAQTKADILEPLIYAIILGILFILRHPVIMRYLDRRY